MAAKWLLVTCLKLKSNSREIKGVYRSVIGGNSSHAITKLAIKGAQLNV